MYTETVS